MLLPTELLGVIVDTLALPIHPQAYGFDADVLRSLVHLCSSSTTLYNIASPHLYSSVIISSSNQLHSFVDTLHNTKGRLSSALQSLCLRDFDDALEEEAVGDLIALLVLLRGCSPGLRRLIIDRDLRAWLDPIDYMSDSSSNEDPETCGVQPGLIGKLRSEIRSGLDALQGLEELCSIQDEVFLRSVETDDTWGYNSGWKDHRQLRYLSLYNPVIDSRLAQDIIHLNFLRCLVLVRPDAVDDTMVNFFRAVMATCRVMLMGPLSSVTLDEIKEAVIEAQPKCEIVYIEAPADGDNLICEVQLWVRQQLERGAMFEAKGTIIWHRWEERNGIRA